MKRNKFKLLGIIAAVAVIGFSMAGCSDNGGNCPGFGDCRIIFVETSPGSGVFWSTGDGNIFCPSDGCAIRNEDRWDASVVSGATIHCDC